MRPIKLTYSPVTTSQNGFANNITGGSWALTATSSGDGLAHLFTIHNDSATDHSAKTAVIIGTDSDGKPQTETMNLPAGTATTTSTKFFKTVTSVTPSASIGADTMDLGWNVSAVSRTIPLNWREAPFSLNYALAVSGTVSVTVQHTSD